MQDISPQYALTVTCVYGEYNNKTACALAKQSLTFSALAVQVETKFTPLS